MVYIITAENRTHYRAALDNMHRERKAVFVDQLRWNVPCDGEFERDEFDDLDAQYMVEVDTATQAHLGSMRLLRTEGAHILGGYFAELCDNGVPNGPNVREITRLCLSRKLRAGERRIVFHRLVTALVEYALITGVTAYTAVTSMHWLSQTLALGWSCRPLGMPRLHEGDTICAMMIYIEPDTINLLRDAGTYQPTRLELAGDLAAAA